MQKAAVTKIQLTLDVDEYERLRQLADILVTNPGQAAQDLLDDDDWELLNDLAYTPYEDGEDDSDDE